MKHVIKVSEARAILAQGEGLGVPLIRKCREGNMIYYTADPGEMERWRLAQSRATTNTSTGDANG